MIRTILAEDNTTTLELIESHLAIDPFIEIVGKVQTGLALIPLARNVKPDLVLMDMHMPELNGIEATLKLKTEFKDLKIIMLTSYDLKEYRKASKDAGADAYVLKKHMYNELLPTIYGLFS